MLKICDLVYVTHITLVCQDRESTRFVVGLHRIPVLSVIDFINAIYLDKF